MSTEVGIDGQLITWSSGVATSGQGKLRFDPVLATASDRPDVLSIPSLVDPAADHLEPEIVARRHEVEEKHQRVIAFLDQHDHDALLLTRADSIAWFTSGGDLGQNLGSDLATVALFINRGSRAILADNVQTPRVFDEEVAGLGFSLKERPWHVDDSRVIAELTRNKRIATDGHHAGLIADNDGIRKLRSPLTPLERDRLRALGRTLTVAIEATCRNFLPGETEADVAGHLAHRLIREGVVPVDLRVAGDDRLARYRQPVFKSAPIRTRATITAIGRRHGLCASVTRTVAFGKPADRLLADHTIASMVDATCIYFSRPGEPVAEVLRKARRNYEKMDHPHEWTLDYQGAMIVIDSRGFEVVTEAQNWPKVAVSVKGFSIDRPGILQR